MPDPIVWEGKLLYNTLILKNSLFYFLHKKHIFGWVSLETIFSGFVTRRKESSGIITTWSLYSPPSYIITYE